MDGETFDALVRRALGGPSRRGVMRAGIGVVAASAMETLGLSALHDAKAGKKKKGKKKKKRKKKDKNQNQNQSPPPDPPPPPTCTDGVKNGSETDVDCGGACPRCANGQACASNSDCLGALCIANICQACTTDEQCNDVSKEICTCEQTRNGQQVCKPGVTPIGVANCDDCPPGTNCFPGFDEQCVRPCGAI